MTQGPEDQKTAVRQPGRHSYHTPRLFVYGAVREVTLGGASGNQENDNSKTGGSPFKRN